MATILIVDDEPGIRGLLEEILTDEGHAVDLAKNAQEARTYRQNKTPDLVLLDIWMPDTDGVTLLKEWAAQGLLTMPVIMMSGHATINTAVEATKIGASSFLEKPISMQKLLCAIKKGLERGTPIAHPPMMQTHQPNNPAPVAQPNANQVVPELTVTPPTAEERFAERLAAISFGTTLRDAREAFERIYFEYHLEQAKGSMTRVAGCTGLERTHLYRKMRCLGVDIKRNKGDS